MKNLKTAVPTSVLGLSSFGLGYMSSGLEEPVIEPICQQAPHVEMAIVQFTELAGDLLQLSVNGPVRLVWNDDFTEDQGEQSIPLGQLPSEYDKPFREFAYVGNAGTMKFYPSNTYAARGTDPRKRRFFATRNEAEAAGFKASKLVK